VLINDCGILVGVENLPTLLTSLIIIIMISAMTFNEVVNLPVGFCCNFVKPFPNKSVCVFLKKNVNKKRNQLLWTVLLLARKVNF
jgi:hypothetical protein